MRKNGLLIKSLKLAINDLLENSYFTMGNMSFHQFFEISMGFDEAPFNTILFLYCYARKWLFNIYKQNLQGTSKFSNTSRLIDYLCSFSNEEFEDNCNDIYPD